MRWVIGDIHGMQRALVGLLGAIGRRDRGATFLFAGDYVNRGPDARGVIDLLLSLGPAARFVRGNHDDVFDLIVNGRCYCDYPNRNDPLSAFDWFMNFGLANTYNSYGADYADLDHLWRRPAPDRLARLNEIVPDAHRTFIRSLTPVIQDDDLFVAHAMWDPDDPDEPRQIAASLAASAKLRFQLVWGRYGDEEIARKKRWSRTGYFGHTPVFHYGESLTGGGKLPIRGPKIMLMDTGAALVAGGLLSAACADTGEIVQVDRSGAPVEAE